MLKCQRRENAVRQQVSLILTIALLGLAICSRSGAETNTVTGLQTHFESGALSDKELATVIRLAKQCGISNAVEVDTVYYLPTQDRGIEVRGAENIRGRKISFVTVNIDREKWSGKETRRQSKVLKSIGEFWVSSYGVRTNVFTTFSVNGGRIRVRLSEDIPLPIADKIIDAFVARKIRLSSGSILDKSQLERVDFSKPESLCQTKEGFHISYATGSTSWIVLDFTFDSDGVTITSIGTVYV
jgi:hypothetical protein